MSTSASPPGFGSPPPTTPTTRCRISASRSGTARSPPTGSPPTAPASTLGGLNGGPHNIAKGKEACVDTLAHTCRIVIAVKADSDAASGSYAPTITVCGGGQTTCPTPAASADPDPFEVTPFDFHLTEFDGETLDGLGGLENRAGAHPYSASTDFFLSTFLGQNGVEFSTDQLKDAIVHLPPGLVGNPTAAPTCTQQQLSSGSCPYESQVGTVYIDFNGVTGDGAEGLTGVYNMERPKGLPALFGFNFINNITEIYAKLRSGDDYGADVAAVNAPETLPVQGVTFDFWGVPADPSHDPQRVCDILNFQYGCSSADSADPKPFLSLPTSCTGPLQIPIDVTGWLGHSTSASFTSHQPGDPSSTVGVEGCNSVPFAPTLQARPTTNVGDAPSGLDVDLSSAPERGSRRDRHRPPAATPPSPCPRAW